MWFRDAVTSAKERRTSGVKVHTLSRINARIDEALVTVMKSEKQ